MTETILTVTDLNISLPATADRAFAVENAAFSLKKGEVLCVIGESGSGKSMIANAIMGLLPRPAVNISKGAIRFDDIDLTRLDDAGFRALRAARIGMIFQEPMNALNPVMRIGDQMMEVYEAHNLFTKAERRERSLQLLRDVEMPDPEGVFDTYPFRLSGGQRQRVMIAMALALNPEILIADEPTTALDVTVQAQILKLIRKLQTERGMAVLFITHDFGVVEDIADRVVVMKWGEIVEAGTVNEVLSNSQHEYTKKLIDAVPSMTPPVREKIERDVVLRVAGLDKNFNVKGGLFRAGRKVAAAQKINLEIRSGETVGVVGESGSGKSTLGRLIAMFLTADGGEITLDGTDMLALEGEELRQMRRKVQVVFQDPFASLNPRQSIGTILTEGVRNYGMSKAEAHANAVEMMEIVGLGERAMKRYPHEFSGGQRQRIAIARALMMEPGLLIADESVSALDVSIQKQILELFDQIQKRLNLAMLFITHDLRVAAHVCDRIAVMQHGKIVETAPTAELFSNPQSAYTRALLSAVPGRTREMQGVGGGA